MKVVWSEAFDDMLIDLLDGEMSYKQIAREMTVAFKAKFTKNSCIGRARRLGMPPRPIKVISMEDSISVVPYDVPRSKKGEPVTIYELRDGMCRWPHGKHPPYLYCGKPTNDFVSWCPEHCKVVFGRATYSNASPVRPV